MHTETQDAATWWARPRGAQASEWIATYQNSLQARHRTVLVDLVRPIQPATVLEIGCHCGPNLIRLCETFPSLTGHGVDANADAIAAGTRWIETRGLDERIELQAGTFPAVTRSVANGAVDLVVTCYTLAYVAPSDLGDALYEVGRLAAKAVILLEPMRLGGIGGESRSLSGYSEWAHDYAGASQWVNALAGWAKQMVPISPSVDRLNGALVLTRCS